MGFPPLSSIALYRLDASAVADLLREIGRRGALSDDLGKAVRFRDLEDFQFRFRRTKG